MIIVLAICITIRVIVLKLGLILVLLIIIIIHLSIVGYLWLVLYIIGLITNSSIDILGLIWLTITILVGWAIIYTAISIIIWNNRRISSLV